MSDLSSMKAGDKVFTNVGWSGMAVANIEKVGKLHVTLSGGAKYNIRSGGRVGCDRYSRDYIRPYVESEWIAYKQDLAEKILRRELSGFNWNSLNIEIARTIHAMLPKPAPVAE